MKNPFSFFFLSLFNSNQLYFYCFASLKEIDVRNIEEYFSTCEKSANNEENE